MNNKCYLQQTAEKKRKRQDRIKRLKTQYGTSLIRPNNETKEKVI